MTPAEISVSGQQTHKLVADLPDRSQAHKLAGAIENFLEPAPVALTLFERPGIDGGPAGWRMEAYFDSPPDIPAIRTCLSDLVGIDVPDLAIEEIPDLNWVALSQSALPPVVAGRFTVHGSHDAHRVAQGPNAIRVEAGEAFGTAHHATTYGCLLALDRLTRRRRYRNILDLGTGSGVLAIALARVLPAARIIATDLDRRSVEVARENMIANRVANRIRALQASGLDCPVLRQSRAFDLIVANILAGPLHALAPAIARKLQAGGNLVLSGLLIHQAPQIIVRYNSQGLVLSAHDRVAGWSTLTLKKRAIAPSRQDA